MKDFQKTALSKNRDLKKAKGGPMELLSLEEERLFYWFGDGNLQNTIKRLQYVGMMATDNDFKKVVFGLSNGKLQTEEYASVYEDIRSIGTRTIIYP